MANRFVELVDSGRIADADALKRAFRVAAKRIHPDLAVRPDAAEAPASSDAARDAEAAARAFIALRADYEAALDYLAGRARGGEAARAEGPAAPPPGGAAPAGAEIAVYAYARAEFYASLEDLVARGFPRPPRAAYPRKGYASARSRVLSYLAGRDEVYPEDRALESFLAFEAGYAALARPGSGWLSVENDPARSIYFILSNVLLYHEMGFAHLAAFPRNTLPLAESLLRGRGETRPIPFLDLLVADLGPGPACVG